MPALLPPTYTTWTDGGVQPYDGALLLYLNTPLPTGTTLSPGFVTKILNADGSTASQTASGSIILLPGRKVVAFLPAAPGFDQEPNTTTARNYSLDFTSTTSGLSHVAPYHMQFACITGVSDATGPWVKQVLPGENYINVATDFIPTITWSQPLDPAKVSAANVTFVRADTGGAVSFALSFNYDTNQMTLTPTAALLADTSYTITLGTAFANLMGKPLLNAFSWSFQTRPQRPLAVAGQGPYVQAAIPADFTIGIEPWSSLGLTFSEAMDASTLTAANIHLTAAGTDVPVTLSYDSVTSVLELIQVNFLNSSTNYVLALDGAKILSAAATPLALQGNTTFEFTTVSNPYSYAAGPTDAVSGMVDMQQGPPIKLNLAYGDGDGDAGGGVKLVATLPNGSVREQSFGPVPSGMKYEDTPEYPVGTSFVITPTFTSGDDPDVNEEMQEVGVTVALAQTSANTGANYAAFIETGSVVNSVSMLAAGAAAAAPALVQAADGTGPQSAVVKQILIDPIATDKGRLGDTVPSNHEGSTDPNVQPERHFVTPMKSDYLTDTYATFQTNLTDAEFAKYSWSGDGAPVSGQPKQWKVSRENTGHFTVNLLSKSDNSVAAKLNVWVVWCTPVAQTSATAVDFRDGRPSSGLASSMYSAPTNNNGWVFRFTITPSEIVDVTKEIPDLSGNAVNPAPGDGKPYYAQAAPNPKISGDFAPLKWDVSRKVEITLKNPGLIPEPNIKIVYGSTISANQPVPYDVPVHYPPNDAEGNDHPKGAVQGNDPYHYALSGNPLDHAVGELTSLDRAVHYILNSWGAADRTFVVEDRFIEFARVELWDRKRTSGTFWFRISDIDKGKWHHYMRSVWDASAPLPWKDDPSNPSDSGSDVPTP